jgi:hypothetical protein
MVRDHLPRAWPPRRAWPRSLGSAAARTTLLLERDHALARERRGCQRSDRKIEAALPDGFSIKDAYASVDLRGQGFRVLFEAEWVWLDPDHASTRHPANEKGENTDWFNVNSEAELLEWEAAWAAAGSPSETQVFPPALLKEKSLAFLGARREGEIVAGAAANRSEGNVVGFSNFFSPASGRESFRAEAVARVAEFSPGAPVVGYERGDDLEGMLALGFRSVGKLTVWIWP